MQSENFQGVLRAVAIVLGDPICARSVVIQVYTSLRQEKSERRCERPYLKELCSLLLFLKAFSLQCAPERP